MKKEERMHRHGMTLLLIFGLTLAASCFAEEALAQDPVSTPISIKEILEKPSTYEGSQVTVTGFVMGTPTQINSSTVRYSLRDDRNVREGQDGFFVIWVRTIKALPEVNSHVKVTGFLEIDRTGPPEKWMPEIREVSREGDEPPPVLVLDPVSKSMFDKATAAGTFEFQGVTYYFETHENLRSFRADPGKYVKIIDPPPEGIPSWLIVLFICVGLILVGLFIYLFRSLSRPTITTGVGGTGLPTFDLPNGETIKLTPVTDRKTGVAMHVPPKNTLKVWPGRFEVVGGDTIREIRFYSVPGENVIERTFGRENGDPITHVALSSPTVSARQAKVTLANGRYSIINYSKTNPTKVNGREIGPSESCPLDEGADIEMGEVRLIYHEN